MFRSSLALSLLVVSAVCAPACTKTDEISFVLRVPPEVRADVRWFELGAFASRTCPSVQQLSGGLPRGSLTHRLTFASDGAPPKMTLDAGHYAFAATARNTQCEAVAAGCTEIEVPGSDPVEINLLATTAKGGKCATGAACVQAECLPAPVDSIGDTCTLDALGAGPLEWIRQGTPVFSRPTITAVNDGFVIAYAQWAGGIYQLTTLKVGDDGGPVAATGSSLPYFNFPVPEPCETDSDVSGIGMLFAAPDSPAGFLLAPHSPKCGAPDGGERHAWHSYTVAASAQPTVPPLAAPYVTDAGTDRQVWTQRAVAKGGYLARVVDGRAWLTRIRDGVESPGVAQAVLAPGPHALTWVAASDTGIALVTQSAQTVDSGAPESSGDDRELHVEVATLQPPSAFALRTPPLLGRFGAVAIDGQRAVVVTSGPVSAPLRYAAFNLGDTTINPASVEGLAAERGAAVGADVAVANDRMFIAAILSTGISVVAYDDFGADPPKFLKATALERQRSVANWMGGILDDLRDGYVSIAATATRVGVVWITGQRLESGEAAGGWAVLTCR